jgi:hypothetical protein
MFLQAAELPPGAGQKDVQKEAWRTCRPVGKDRIDNIQILLETTGILKVLQKGCG